MPNDVKVEFQFDFGSPNAYLAELQDDVKQRLIKDTKDAVARGAFGSPTFFVGSEMFFGKDQLRDVEESIVRQSSAAKQNQPEANLEGPAALPD